MSSQSRHSEAQDRHLVAQHDDLQFLELAGAKPKNDQLQHTLEHNVPGGQEHDASRRESRSAGYSTQIEFLHPTGEERIAAELRVKLGLTVSPRTVRRYMPSRPRPRGGRSAQSWAVFLHNHAGAVLACDFFIVVTATFRRLYVFVLLDIGTRRIVHWNLTDHPRSEWTIQQFRNGLPLDGAYRFLVHDRDGIFAPAVDEALRSMSLQVLKTTVRAPQANAHCERFIGTARRECLDWIIPLNERHLRSVLAKWIHHYNGERPHSALGVGCKNLITPPRCTRESHHRDGRDGAHKPRQPPRPMNVLACDRDQTFTDQFDDVFHESGSERVPDGTPTSRSVGERAG
jgi:putative transposase